MLLPITRYVINDGSIVSKGSEQIYILWMVNFG